MCRLYNLGTVTEQTKIENIKPLSCFDNGSYESEGRAKCRTRRTFYPFSGVPLGSGLQEQCRLSGYRLSAELFPDCQPSVSYRVTIVSQLHGIQRPMAGRFSCCPALQNRTPSTDGSAALRTTTA